MIKYIITDFDGTLVDTKEANIMAYRNAFSQCGYEFDDSLYEKAFGLRFDDMCNTLGIPDDSTIRNKIRTAKSIEYIKYFNLIKVNTALVHFISSLPDVKVAIATTASKKNFTNVTDNVVKTKFDIVVTGEDVKHGKPDPEVYIKALEKLGCKDPSEVLVFEDSETGIKAATKAGLYNIVKVTL